MTKRAEVKYFIIKVIILLLALIGVWTGHSIGRDNLYVNIFFTISLLIAFLGSHFFYRSYKLPLFKVKKIEQLNVRDWYSHASIMARDIPFLLAVLFTWIVLFTYIDQVLNEPEKNHSNQIILLVISLFAVFLTVYQVISTNTIKEINRKSFALKAQDEIKKEEELKKEKDEIKELIKKQTELLNKLNSTLSEQNQTIEDLKTEISNQDRIISDFKRSSNETLLSMVFKRLIQKQ